MEKEIERDVIMEGKIMTVTKEKVLLPDGNTAYREVVYHHGGVSILGIHDDKIILVKQFRYPNRIETLEIPAGKLEEGEDTKECAFREFEEETSNRAEDMKFLFKFLPSPGYTNEWISIYQAINFKHVDDALEQDPDEYLNLIEIPIDEAYSMVLDGSIVDAKTALAIFYAYNQKHIK